MKKALPLLLFRKAALLIIFVSCSLQLMATRPVSVVKRNFTSFTSQQKYQNIEKLKELNTPADLMNPDFGTISPGIDPSWYEIYSKRTLTSRSFIKDDGALINGNAYSPVHYVDTKGNYLAINPNLSPVENGWSSMQQEFPTYLHPDGSTEISINGNERIQFNLSNSINGNAISMSSFTVGDNGMMIYNASPGIDKRIAFNLNRIETDYLLNKPIANLSGDLVISEEIILPEGYSIKEKSLDYIYGQGTNHTEMVVVDGTGKEYAHFKMPFCYDSNKESGDVRSTSFGKYNLRSVGEKNFLDVVISSAWLNDAARVYPVTVDPIVNGPTSLLAAYSFPSCYTPTYYSDPNVNDPYSSTIDVTIPADITVTALYVQSSFYADPMYDAFVSDGIAYFKTPCDSTGPYQGTGCNPPPGFCFTEPGTGYITWNDPNNPNPGGPPYDDPIDSTLICCFAPSCSQQTFPLTMFLTRTYGDPGMCNDFNYIYYEPSAGDIYCPFEAFIQGYTVQLKNGSASWSVTPTSLCSNSCTLNLSAPVSYGVPPYIMTDAWTASIDTFGTQTACNSSGGTGTFTLTIPGCPGPLCGADSTKNVPTPVIKDQCGLLPTVFAKTFTKVPIPVVTPNPALPSVCSGSQLNVTLTSCVAGSTIKWSGNGRNNQSGNIVDNPVNNGSSPITITYSVTVSNGTCTGSSITVPVTVNPAPTVAVSPASASVCPGDSATLTASGGVSYIWSPSAGLSSSSGAVVNAVPGTYSVKGTDVNGCTATKGVTVSSGTSLTIAVNPTSSTVCSGKSVTLIASGATNYSWSPSAELSYISAHGDTAITVNNLGSQIVFSINGTTGGCTGFTYDTVKVGTSPTVGASSTSATYCPGQSVTLTGSGAPANGYSWSTGATTSSISISATGTYTVTGTNAAGCSNTSTITINAGSPPVINVTSSYASVCPGGTPATLVASGGATYSWSTGATTTSINVPTIGTYTLTGTNINGCSAAATITVTVSPPPSVSISPASPSVCSGGTPATLTASGTSTSYSWSAGVSPTTGATVEASSAGMYTVTGTDAHGCINTASVTVTNRTPPPISITSAPANATVCSGQSDTLTGTGGSTYQWSSGLSASSGTTVFATTNGTYTVTGTDSHGCTNTATLTVVVNPTFSLNATPIINICPGDTAYIDVTGAPNGSFYSWTPGTNLSCNNCSNPEAYPSSPVTYTVTATSSSGCSETDTVNVDAAPLSPTASASQALVCYGSTDTLTATGGAAYLWTPSAGLTDSTSASIIITALTSTNYTVTVSRGSCSATQTTSITVNSQPVIPRIRKSQTGDTLFCTAPVTYATYQWYFNNTMLSGQTDSIYIAGQDGNYNVVVKDGNGCSVSAGTNIVISGVYNFSSDHSITLFPNPANDELTIRSASIHGNEPVLISVMDVLGKTIQKENTTWSDHTAINIKNLSAGIYFLQLQFTMAEQQGKWIGRFVKE